MAQCTPVGAGCADRHPGIEAAARYREVSEYLAGTIGIHGVCLETRSVLVPSPILWQHQHSDLFTVDGRWRGASGALQVNALETATFNRPLGHAQPTTVQVMPLPPFPPQKKEDHQNHPRTRPAPESLHEQPAGQQLAVTSLGDCASGYQLTADIWRDGRVTWPSESSRTRQ